MLGEKRYSLFNWLTIVLIIIILGMLWVIMAEKQSSAQGREYREENLDFKCKEGTYQACINNGEKFIACSNLSQFSVPTCMRAEPLNYLN